MIPKAKGHIYSYRDFTDEDLRVLPKETEEVFIEDLRKFDTISYLDLSSADYWQFISEQCKMYSADISGKFKYKHKHFLKEFCINIPDPDSSTSELINRYRLSDWDPRKKINEIDDRTLKIDLYSYIERVDSLYVLNSYMIKSEHIYQLVLDLVKQIRWTDELVRDGRGDEYVNDNVINLYVLPIYILDVENDKYLRISDWSYGNISYNEYYDLIYDLYEALKAYIGTNYYMLNLYNNNEKVSVYNKSKRSLTDMTFKAYATTANGDKKIYTNLYRNDNLSTPKIEISINPDEENVLAGAVIPRKLCDYRFTVRGHYTHVWRGKKGEQVREKVWVDSYEKNKEKPWKIIKETRLK